MKKYLFFKNKGLQRIIILISIIIYITFHFIDDSINDYVVRGRVINFLIIPIGIFFVYSIIAITINWIQEGFEKPKEDSNNE